MTAIVFDKVVVLCFLCDYDTDVILSPKGKTMEIDNGDCHDHNDDDHDNQDNSACVAMVPMHHHE